MAQESLESGVIIRLNGDDRLLNTVRLTTVPEETEQTVRAAAKATAKADDPIGLIPDEQQKQEEAREKAAHELAEKTVCDGLPDMASPEEVKRDPLVSTDDERTTQQLVRKQCCVLNGSGLSINQRKPSSLKKRWEVTDASSVFSAGAETPLPAYLISAAAWRFWRWEWTISPRPFSCLRW
ncbi:hypothetical protein SAMN02744775_04295 [Enterobacter sp. CC120223-11]|nr:hypothetical protein [Enterobacter sp. CC120223-11]SNY79904.1 hypothetical protein SAMN02744775_04295 [Enterobacter sp. CC120223-11]